MRIRKMTLIDKIEAPGHVPTLKDMFMNLDAETVRDGIVIPGKHRDAQGNEEAIEILIPWHMVRSVHADPRKPPGK
jgi:sporulation protein YlmC with PRC-barrel domain